MPKVKLSSPWVILYRKIEAFFEKDPGVKVNYDKDANRISLYVEDGEKADALRDLLPARVNYGNVTIYIDVRPANVEGNDKTELLKRALEGNEALDFIYTADTRLGKMNYVVFKKEVVQYFNDDLGDRHGVCSTLYQEIAKELFGQSDGIFYCTNIE